MQILKRARNAELEIISASESESNVKDEVNRRSYKAGYTNKEGGPFRSSKIWSAGGIGNNKVKLWPRDKQGNLIE